MPPLFLDYFQTAAHLSRLQSYGGVGQEAVLQELGAVLGAGWNSSLDQFRDSFRPVSTTTQTSLANLIASSQISKDRSGGQSGFLHPGIWSTSPPHRHAKPVLQAASQDDSSFFLPHPLVFPAYAEAQTDPMAEVELFKLARTHPAEAIPALLDLSHKHLVAYEALKALAAVGIAEAKTAIETYERRRRFPDTVIAAYPDPSQPKSPYDLILETSGEVAYWRMIFRMAAGARENLDLLKGLGELYHSPEAQWIQRNLDTSHYKEEAERGNLKGFLGLVHLFFFNAQAVEDLDPLLPSIKTIAEASPELVSALLKYEGIHPTFPAILESLDFHLMESIGRVHLEAVQVMGRAGVDGNKSAFKALQNLSEDAGVSPNIRQAASRHIRHIKVLRPLSAEESAALEVERIALEAMEDPDAVHKLCRLRDQNVPGAQEAIMRLVIATHFERINQDDKYAAAVYDLAKSGRPDAAEMLEWNSKINPTLKFFVEALEMEGILPLDPKRGVKGGE